MVKTVTYEQLRQVLTSLGYGPERIGDDRVVFRNPDRHLFIILPDMRERDTVRPIDMLRVQTALVNDGVVEEDQFDSLFRIQKGDQLIWTNPATGKEVRVTAVAGESDGLVIVKQKGAFMPCPVDQLRRDEDVSTSANGRR